MKQLKTDVLLLALLYILSACSGGGSPIVPVNKLGDPIIDDQFLDEKVDFSDPDPVVEEGGGLRESVPLFMVLLKLKTPPLLTQLTRSKDGQYQIDPELQLAIQEEQNTLLAKLQNISPEIRVLYKYERVLNALAIEAPQSLAHDINNLDVDLVEGIGRFSEPQFIQKKNIREKKSGRMMQTNSINFLGVDRIHSELKVKDSKGQLQPVMGQGVKVGIIDSGLDYTHQMLGGSGDSTNFNSVNSNSSTPFFPNSKVVGGYDFAGATFNPGSHLYSHKVVVPDVNPIDRMGHGTHVAGTVAGVGDGVNTYSGAAPEAELYALKVFGDAGGGTMDSVVIAALEYAADPNSDYKLDDKLDVINLSLGGDFGKPHNMYGEAISNLTKAGVVVVAAAGNSGAFSSVVGAPSTVDEALSVAASVDNSPHIWQLPAIEFIGSEGFSSLEVLVEGQSTKPLAEINSLSGDLVPIGLAAEELSAEVVAQVAGQVALIDRGQVSFDDKIERAQRAGALAVVMVNNEPGDPIGMAGSIPFKIPGVMISQSMGRQIKNMIKKGLPVSVNFKPEKLIEKPELIDTITSFSSQGPRDLDALIKPEVSAPGFAIISAAMGSGNKGVSQFGTSMASPHVAGVAALAVQYRRDLNAKQIKSILMNSGRKLSDEQGLTYPISRQGAGRIQGFEALTSSVAVLTPALSLGKIPATEMGWRTETLELQNITSTRQTYSLSAESNKNMQLSFSLSQLALEPGEVGKVDVLVKMQVPAEELVELDAFIKVANGGRQVAAVPVMAVVNRTTLMGFDQLSIAANGVGENQGATASARISNAGAQEGLVLLFNLLGHDQRKKEESAFLSQACDLQSSGYRIVEQNKVKYLQFAVKVFNPVTWWFACDVNVDFDFDGNGEPDKQLSGTSSARIPGLQGLNVPDLASILFDTKKLDAISQEYNDQIAEQKADRPSVDFRPAINSVEPMVAFHQSTISMVQVPVVTLGRHESVNVRVSVSYNGTDVVEQDDILQHEAGEWKQLALNKSQQPYYDMPEFNQVVGYGVEEVQMKRGASRDTELVAFFPRNEFILETLGFDSQSQVRKPSLNEPIVHP